MLEDSLVDLLAKQLVNMLARALVNMLAEVTDEYVWHVTDQHVGRVTGKYIDQVTGKNLTWSLVKKFDYFMRIYLQKIFLIVFSYLNQRPVSVEVVIRHGFSSKMELFF